LRRKNNSFIIALAEAVRNSSLKTEYCSAKSFPHNILRPSPAVFSRDRNSLTDSKQLTGYQGTSLLYPQYFTDKFFGFNILADQGPDQGPASD
jgi:hypothetical protein